VRQRAWFTAGGRLAWVVLAVLSVVAAACGPFADHRLEGDSVPIPEEGRSGGVYDFSISPLGDLLLVGTMRFDAAGFKLYLYRFADRSVVELSPNEGAQAQMLIEKRPVIRAAVWDEEDSTARFPAFSILGADRPVPIGAGRLAEIGFVPEDTAWYRADWASGQAASLTLEDSYAERHRPIEAHPLVDSRIWFRMKSRQESRFDLLDHQAGDRKIASFHGWWLSIDPDTASLSPNGQWIGVTVGRENFGNKGTYGYLVRRSDGETALLAKNVSQPLQFGPTKPEVFGVCEEPPFYGQWVLMRWDYSQL
jgi:hypothetical protein